MKLIGMLDSPYVRRTAISLRCMGLDVEHQAVSVFTHFAAFQAINPVVKAPTLVLANGDILMDSNLIIQYGESLVAAEKRLTPTNPQSLQQGLQIIGFALAACEKAVQLIYEKNLRPPEKQFAPWQERVTGQLIAACNALENKLSQGETAITPRQLTQPFITSAVAWQFMQSMLGELLPAAQYPVLQNLSAYAESLPVFLAYPPTGPGVMAAGNQASRETTKNS